MNSEGFGMQKWKVPTDRNQRVDDKNGVICLVIMFTSWVIVIKMSKMILFCTFCWWQQKLVTFKTLDKIFKCKQRTFLSFSRNWYANISYISRVDIVSQGFLMVHFLEERNKIIQVHLNIFPKLWLIFCSQWTIFEITLQVKIFQLRAKFFKCLFVVYLIQIFQWPQEGLNCESLAYKVVT